MVKLNSKQVFCYLLSLPYYKPTKSKAIGQASKLGLLNRSSVEAIEKMFARLREQATAKPKGPGEYLLPDRSNWPKFTTALSGILKKGKNVSLEQIVEKWGRMSLKVLSGLKVYYDCEGDLEKVKRYEERNAQLTAYL